MPKRDWKKHRVEAMSRRFSVAQKEDNKMYKCPYCGSKRVFRYIHDCDCGWEESYYPLNPVEDTNIYNESDLDDPTPPDIDICHCRNCNMLFELTKAEM